MQDSQEPGAGTASPKPSDSTNSSPMHPLPSSSPSTAAEVVARTTPAEKSTTLSKNNEDADYVIVSSGAEALQAETTTSDSMADQDTAILQLLQLAQNSGVGPVTIPGNLLASLLTSMSNLHTQVSTLKSAVLRLEVESSTSRTRLNHTKLELMVAKEEFGITRILIFPLFPKLPIEVRLMIWRLALRSPKVIGASSPNSVKGPRPSNDVVARHNNIRGVCREARVEAIKWQLRLMDKEGWKVFDNPLGFANERLDYLWAHGTREGGFDSCYDFISNIAHFVCAGPIGTYLMFDNLILSLDDWLEFVDDLDDESITYNLSRIAELGTVHILVVLGDLDALHYPDVRLIAPRNDPVSLLPEKYLDVIEKKNTELSKPSTDEQLLTWEGLEAWHAECLRDFQEKRAALRKKMVEDGVATDEEDLENFDFGYAGDCSEWLIKTIQFVEATSQQQQKKRLQMS